MASGGFVFTYDVTIDDPDMARAYQYRLEAKLEGSRRAAEEDPRTPVPRVVPMELYEVVALYATAQKL